MAAPVRLDEWWVFCEDWRDIREKDLTLPVSELGRARGYALSWESSHQPGKYFDFRLYDDVLRFGFDRFSSLADKQKQRPHVVWRPRCFERREFSPARLSAAGSVLGKFLETLSENNEGEG